MEVQPEYGIHFITVGGKYISIREDYIEREVNNTNSLRVSMLHTKT
mgnify:CR=1 FL=1